MSSDTVLSRRPRRRSVPIRTMLAVVASVLATYLGVQILIKLHQVVIWTVISCLFAIVLHPPVTFLVYRLKLRRSIAALLVFLAGIGLVGGLGYLFVRPLVDQVNVAVNDFPSYVADARAGRGAIGHLVKKYNLDNYVQRNQPNLKNALQTAGKPAVQVAKGLLNTLAAVATITVMTFLLLLEGPRMMEGGLAVLSPPAQERVSSILREIVRALAGYLGGVLATSVLNGVVAYFALWALGIPFRGVLALWIGFTALIPVVGSVLGVLPAAAVGLIHSTPAGIAIVVIIFSSHLIENRTLSKKINERTVALSPLAVALSILAGYQLLGFLGVFLAIPGAGVIHVVVRHTWAYRHRAPAVAAAAAASTGAPTTAAVKA